MRTPSEQPGGDDIGIIRRVLDGDVNAFETLLIRYEPHVLKLLKKRLPADRVEEVAQDVFIQAYRSLATYAQKSEFKSWLTAVAVRTCYDFWRKAYRNREMPLSSLSEEQQSWLEKLISDQSGNDFEAAGRRKEARELLDWALAKLSPEDRAVLELVYLEERSVKEAARLLGWSVANVKVRAFRARKKLNGLLSKHVERTDA